MPPKTRRAGNGPTATGQSTLSFKNRISKPQDSTTALRNAKSKLNEPAKEIVAEEIGNKNALDPEEQQPTDESQIQQSPVRLVPSPSRRRKVRRSINDDEDEVTYGEAEKRARNTSDAQIRKYWNTEEDSRLAPRVHQKDLHMHEKILRHFDLSSEYGPCIGLTRLRRWKRAHGLSLNPPVEVLAVLLKEDAKGSKSGDQRATGTIAYVDELGGARGVEVAV